MAFSPRSGAVISFTVEGAQTAQRQIETIGSSFDQLSSVASTGLKALAAGFAALKIGEYLKDSTMLAARYETLAIVMHTAGENAGYSSAQMDSYARGLEKSGISMMKAREAMIAMTTANLDNSKSLELGRLAQNLAVVANKSSSETLTDLITNIQQADTEGLKHMGIILNQDEALQKYAASHGTVSKALTQTQKAEAIHAAVMQQGAKYASIYEKAMGTAGKALSSLDRYFENIKVRLGTPFLEGFAQGVFGVTDGVKQLNKWLEQLETNGAMEKVAKSIGSSVGAVISVIKDTIDITGQIVGTVVRVGTAAAEFFDNYLGGMTTVKAATVSFAVLLSGFMVEQAVIGFAAVSTAAWASAGKVGAALVAMGTAATNTFRLMQLSAATLGWGPAIAIAARTAIAALGTAIAAIPGAVGAAVVAAGLGVGYLFAKAFGDQLQKYMPKFIDDAVTKGVAWVVDKTSSLPEVSEAVDRDKAADDAKAAANKAEKDRAEQLMRDMNNSVVGAERQISIVSATNTKLKALNELRDQQLKQSLDLRIITQADYLQKKEKLDVAEAQGQLDQIAAQKAQLAAYMAASKAGAPLGQGRDPAADANEMIKLSGEAAAAQTKLNAVKQNYAYEIAGAVLESYTKEFGSVSSLADAQEELVRTSRQAYAVAGKTAEQQEIFSALRMQSIAAELEAEMEQRRQAGEASTEYLRVTGAMAQAMEQFGAARMKATAKNVSTDFLNDAKRMSDETIALYDEMKNSFIGDEQERIKAAAAAAIKLASIRLADANIAIDNTNDSDDQKLAAKRKALEDFNKYAQAVHDNADAKALQSSRGMQVLGDTIAATFDVNRIESFGQAISGAFGSAGAALGDLIDTLTLYGQQQKDNDAARQAASIAYKDDAGKLAAAQSAITMKQEREQLGYYGNVAGAAKGFFKENSTGYRAMTAVQQAFHAVELALAIESALTKAGLIAGVTAAETTNAAARVATQTTATAASTGLAATEASAWGITAVVKAIASLPFPFNLAAGAATLAAVVGIGAKISGSLGGGSVSLSAQRQQAQGTGSILGDKDAKSESISKALDLIEKNTFQDLAINTSMLASLRNIESSVANFANQLVRSTDISNPDVALKSGVSGANTGSAALAAAGFTAGSMVTLVGGVLGPFGAVAGLVMSKIPVVQKLMTSVFGGKQSVQDSGFGMDATSLASILGSGAKAYQYADIKTSGGWFRSDKDSVKSNPLDDAANQQFTAVITSLADGITAAGSVLGLSGDAFTNKLNSFVVDIGKVSLKDLKGDELQKAIESVFSKLGDDMAQFAVGGLAQFQDVGEGYLETLARIATEYQTVDVVLQSFGKTFGQVGMESVAARDRLVDLAGGLEKFASQGEYFLTNFFSDQEQAAALKQRIAPTLAQYGLSTDGADASKMFRDFLVGLDATTAAGAQAYSVLMTIAPAFKQIVDANKDAADAALEAAEKVRGEQNNLLDLQAQTYALLGDKIGAATVLEKQRAIALESLSPALAAATKELWAAQAAADAISKAQSNASSLMNSVDSAFSALQSVVAREKTAIQSSIDVHTKSVTKLQSLADSLHSALDSIKAPDQGLADRALGQAQIRAALAIARAGGPLPDADGLKKALSAVTQDASSQFSSYTDYLRDLYQTQNDIAGLAGITDHSLSIEEKSLDVLKAQVKQLDLLVSAQQAQVDIQKGASTTLLSIDQAVSGLSLALASAKASPINAATAGITNVYQVTLGRTPDAAGMEYWTGKAAAGESLSNIVRDISGSMEAQVQAAYKELLGGRTADAAGLSYWLQSGLSIDGIKDEIKKSGEYKALHPFAVGTNFIPEDMPAMVHKGERIIPAADNRALFTALASPAQGNAALLVEFRAMREENRALREEVKGLRAETRSIAGHTEKTSRIVRALEGDQLKITTEGA
jgi:hypothetical protein